MRLIKGETYAFLEEDFDGHTQAVNMNNIASIEVEGDKVTISFLDESNDWVYTSDTEQDARDNYDTIIDFISDEIVEADYEDEDDDEEEEDSEN